MRNNGMRLLEIFLRDPQIRRAVVNQGVKTTITLTNGLNDLADTLAWEIAKHKFAKEQQNK